VNEWYLNSNLLRIFKIRNPALRSLGGDLLGVIRLKKGIWSKWRWILRGYPLKNGFAFYFEKILFISVFNDEGELLFHRKGAKDAEEMVKIESVF
jgi:hypothetical protein